MRFTWPLPGPISRGFDYKASFYVGGQHAAIDIPASTGTSIKAVADWEVVGDAWDSLSGYYIVLEHLDGWRSTYRHLWTGSPQAIGRSGSQRQTIGEVGSTGLSTGPHLHFDLWHRQKQDPTAFYKNGWWAHDPELYLGMEDDMAFSDDQKRDIRAACAAAIDDNASGYREWCRRGAVDATRDIIEAVNSISFGGPLNQADLEALAKVMLDKMSKRLKG